MAILQGFAKHLRERRRTWEKGRAAPELGLCCPPTPHIYIGARERGAGPLISNLEGGGGQGGGLPPKQGGCVPLRVPPPTLGAWAQGGAPSPPGAGALPHAAHVVHQEGWPLPVVPVHYRETPKLSRWPKNHFLYIILYLRTIPKLLVTSGISSGTPNNIRYTAYSYSYNPSVTEP